MFSLFHADHQTYSWGCSNSEFGRNLAPNSDATQNYENVIGLCKVMDRVGEEYNSKT